jgi:hypothetical protein
MSKLSGVSGDAEGIMMELGILYQFLFGMNDD